MLSKNEYWIEENNGFFRVYKSHPVITGLKSFRRISEAQRFITTEKAKG